MKTFIVLAALLAVSCALKVKHITGPTPPPVKCSNKLCEGKYDGNFDYKDPHTHKTNPNYFLQCSNGLASCQACWPLSLVFVQRCNQCLYASTDDCVTTQKWHPAVTFACPDKCPHRGHDFSGNIEDPSNKKQYVACWKGVTVGCVACPKGLLFNEQWNACLYDGINHTQPDNQKPPTTTTKAPKKGYPTH